MKVTDPEIQKLLVALEELGFDEAMDVFDQGDAVVLFRQALEDDRTEGLRERLASALKGFDPDPRSRFHVGDRVKFSGPQLARGGAVGSRVYEGIITYVIEGKENPYAVRTYRQRAYTNWRKDAGQLEPISTLAHLLDSMQPHLTDEERNSRDMAELRLLGAAAAALATLLDSHPRSLSGEDLRKTAEARDLLGRRADSIVRAWD